MTNDNIKQKAEERILPEEEKDELGSEYGGKINTLTAKVAIALCQIEVRKKHLGLSEFFDEVSRTWHRYEHEAERLIREMEGNGVSVHLRGESIQQPLIHANHTT